MEELKKLKEQLGLSPEQLAGLLNVSRQTLENWIAGRAEPSQLAQAEIRRFIAELKSRLPGRDNE
jgi:DNA-binding transcriptional regulator YiaG